MKLMYYPDKPDPLGSKLAPDAAVGFPAVSKDGKTYMFTIKSGVKSNTGETLTAANFAAAINRDLNPKMQSPAVPFITGDNGIVGAQAVADGKAATASGVIATGQKLTITADEAGRVVPVEDGDGLLLPDPEGHADQRRRDQHVRVVRAVLRREPSGRPSADHARRTRTTRARGRTTSDTFVFTMNTNLDQSLLQVKAGQADYDAGGLPSTAHAGLAQQYGVNKGRYFVQRRPERRLHRAEHAPGRRSRTSAMRKAANFAVDRPALVRVRGFLAGKRSRSDPAPGHRRLQGRSTRIRSRARTTPKAKTLASRPAAARTSRSTAATAAIGQNLAQVFKYNLSQIGCNVNVKLFQGFQIYIATGTKGEPYDAAFVGWFADYADPYDFIDILLNGENIHEANNNNLAYFNDPTVNEQMRAANALTGDKRGTLRTRTSTASITTKYAPWAAYENRNTREFVSARTGGYLFQAAHGPRTSTPSSSSRKRTRAVFSGRRARPGAHSCPVRRRLRSRARPEGHRLVFGALLDVRTRDASTGRRIPICGDRPPMLGAIGRDFNDAFCS